MIYKHKQTDPLIVTGGRFVLSYSHNLQQAKRQMEMNDKTGYLIWVFYNYKVKLGQDRTHRAIKDS